MMSPHSSTSHSGVASRDTPFYVTKTFHFGAITLLVAVGVAYLVVQWNTTDAILDALFVGILTGASSILLSGVRLMYRYLLNNGASFYAYVIPQDRPQAGYEEYTKLMHQVFNQRLMTLVAIAYGSVVGTSPLLLQVWPTSGILLALLISFLFSANYLTGLALFGLIRFLVQSWKMGKLTRVHLWQRENPSTSFLVGATRRIGILASVYVALCLSSTLVSVFPLGNLVIGYSVFSALMALCAILIPLLPVASKVAEAKGLALVKLNEQLHNEFERLLGAARSGSEDADYSKIESLLALRDRVNSATVWPHRLGAIFASLWVIAISAIPVVLQVLLEKFAK